jgi:hypothetical protein
VKSPCACTKLLVSAGADPLERGIEIDPDFDPAAIP